MKNFSVLSKNLKFRLVIKFLTSFSYGAVIASMTIYYNQHVGATMTGFFLMAIAVATFSAGILAGYQSDLHGRRPVMRAGAVVVQVGSLLAFMSNFVQPVNPWLTFGGFLLISFGSNTTMTAANAMIVDETDEKNRKIVFTLDYWAGNLAIVLGGAVSAWLFKPAFLVVLGLLIAICTVNATIAWFAIKESFIPRKTAAKPENIFRNYAIVLRDRTYMMFLFANILVVMLILQFDNFLAVHLANSFQTTRVFSIEIYGQRMLTIWSMLGNSTVVVLMGTVNKLVKHWAHLRGFVTGGLIMVGGIVLSFMTSTFLPVLLSSIIYSVGELIYSPSAQTLGADLMKAEKIGAYSGIGAIQWPIAGIIASSLVAISLVIKAVGVSIAVVVLTLMAILLCYTAVRRQKAADFL